MALLFTTSSFFSTITSDGPQWIIYLPMIAGMFFYFFALNRVGSKAISTLAQHSPKVAKRYVMNRIAYWKTQLYRFLILALLMLFVELARQEKRRRQL
jgi:TRAP-type C4-dicarboxylate transport system permease small subunit